jgi:hypothetical protein
MLSYYFTRELFYQVILFILAYFIYLKYFTNFNSTTMYTSLFIDTLLVLLFLFLQKILVSYYQTNKFFELNSKITISNSILTE